MVWDNNWLNGGNPRWVRNDDSYPNIRTKLSHVTSNADTWEHIPAVIWVSPFDNFTVDLVGELEFRWFGSNTEPVDAELAIALRDHSEQAVSLLFSSVIEKPEGDEVALPVRLTDLSLDKGDELIITHRGKHILSNRGISLLDSLYLLPHSATHTATVTVEVEENSTPLATAPTPGYALEFDGSNDYVDLGNPPELQMTGNQTIEFWIQPYDFGDRQNPYAKAFAGEGTMTLEKNGMIKYFYGNLGDNSGSGGVDYQGFSTAYSLPLGQWTHVALVRDLDAMKLRWYINGELSNETDALFAAAVAGNNSAFIGRGYVRNFAGQIDEFRIWNSARNAEEIQNSRFASLTGNEEGLVVYYKLNEGAGDTSNDSSPNALNGTLGGGNTEAFPQWIPSFVPFDSARVTDEDTDLLVELEGSDGDGDSLTANILRFPKFGRLFTTSDGATRENPLQGVLVPDPESQGIVRDVFRDLSFSSLSEFTSHPRYPGRPDESYVLTDFLRTPVNEDDHYGQRVYGFLVPPQTGDYIFWIAGDNQSSLRLSSGAEPALAQEIAFVEGHTSPSSWNQEPNQQSEAIPLVAGEVYFIEALMIERAGGDHLAVRWQLPDGTMEDPLPASRLLQPLLASAINVENRQVIYVPDENFFGFDELEYLLSDGKVNSLPAIVPIRVSPVNDAPRVVEDSFQGLQGVALTTGNVLANDSEVEGQPFDVFDFTQAVRGSVEFLGEGRFRYLPEPGFDGEDSFTYRATDGEDVSQPAVVQITVHPLDQFRWINEAGGKWNEPANWSQGVVPGPEDDAVIDLEGEYTVTLNVDAQVRQLLLGGENSAPTLTLNGRTFAVELFGLIREGSTFLFNSGTLQGAGDFNVEGLFHWNGGTMSGLGITWVQSQGTLTMTTSSDKHLRRTVRNHGQAIWEEGRIYFSDGTWINEPDGTFLAPVSNNFHWNGGNNVFRNLGTFRKTAGGTVQFNDGVAFQNEGTTAVDAGSLQLIEDSTHQGHFILAESATLRLGGGTHRFNEGSQFEGLGVFQVAGATFLINAPVEIPLPVEFSNGRINLQNVLTASSELNWSGGTIEGTGSLAIAEIGNLTVSGNADKHLNATINNSGHCGWTGGRWYFSNGTFNNLASGVFTAATANNFSWNGGNNQFNNAGTFRKNLDGLVQFNDGVSFNNSGLTEVLLGPFAAAGGGDHAGTITISENALLSFAGNHTLADASAITGAGGMQITRGTTTANGELSFAGPLSVSGGRANLNQTASLTQLSLSDGAIGGTAEVSLLSSFNWTGGTLDGTGTLRVADSATLSIAGGNDKHLNRILSNAGTAEWTGGRFNFSNGTFNNETGGTFTTATVNNFFWNGGNNNFHNAGAFRKTLDGQVAFNDGVAFHNSGVTEVLAGQLALSGGGSHSGTFSIANSTLLIFNRTHELSDLSSAIGPGSVQVSGGSTTVNGTYNVEGPLVLQGGRINFNTDATMPVLQMQNGALGGSGAVTVSSELAWSGGTLDGSGLLALPAGATALLSSSGDKHLNRIFSNSGSVEWTEGRIYFSNGTFRNEADGTFIAAAAQNLFWNGGDNAFVNQGTFRKTTGDATAANSGVAFHNQGTMDVQAGTFLLNETGSHSGVFQSAETASIVFQAGSHTLEPGASFDGPGEIRIRSPFTLNADIPFGSAKVVFEENAAVTGSFTLSNSPEGRFTFAKSLNIPGSILVAGLLELLDSGHTLTVNQTLTLDNSGELINPGTIITGEFINNGGTITGNAPVLAGASSSSVKITSIQLVEPAFVAEPETQADSVQPVKTATVQLLWKAPPELRFSLETTSDWKRWTAITATVQETVPGQYSAEFTMPDDKPCFFRLRLE